MKRRGGRWWAPALGIGALYCFYAATSFVPPMSINDGCHFALLRAMVERHTFCIDDYAQYTNYFDVAVVDGHYFADRPPGTALIAVPLYAAGRALLGVFEATDRAEPAAIARAVAGALDRAGDVVDQPFVRALARRALEVAGEVATGRLSAATATRKPTPSERVS